MNPVECDRASLDHIPVSRIRVKTSDSRTAVPDSRTAVTDSRIAVPDSCTAETDSGTAFTDSHTAVSNPYTAAAQTLPSNISKHEQPITVQHESERFLISSQNPVRNGSEEGDDCHVGPHCDSFERATIERSPAPDGGWGWLVLAGSFYISVRIPCLLSIV